MPIHVHLFVAFSSMALLQLTHDVVDDSQTNFIQRRIKSARITTDWRKLCCLQTVAAARNFHLGACSSAGSVPQWIPGAQPGRESGGQAETVCRHCLQISTAWLQKRSKFEISYIFSPDFWPVYSTVGGLDPLSP